jgi:hypothetical protein
MRTPWGPNGCMRANSETRSGPSHPMIPPLHDQHRSQQPKQPARGPDPFTPLDNARPHGCGNGVPHSGSRCFADTEEVTGSNPVAPTTILPVHSVASVEPVALATWLGRAGAARRPRRRARLILPDPSTPTSGSGTTTQSSHGSRPSWPPRTVPCGNLAPATPLPQRSHQQQAPLAAVWPARSVGCSLPPKHHPAQVRGRHSPTGLHTTCAAVPASMLLGPSTEPPGTGPDHMKLDSIQS